MKFNKIKIPNFEIFKPSFYFNVNMLKNIFFFSGGIILFIVGVIIYGIILNLREVPLQEVMAEKGITKIENPSIIIERKKYLLSLYEDTVFVKSYRVCFGRNVSNKKLKLNDLATPVGNYKICSIDTSSVYNKFFRLNYPNIDDAIEGLRKGYISQTEFDKIKFEYYYKDCPGSETALGGNIGIHGNGRLNYILKNLPFVFNWTNGSVALSNENIDELYKVIRRGTNVSIK